MTRPSQDPNFLVIFEMYKRYFHCDCSTLGEPGSTLEFPIVPLPILISLCEAATGIFKSEPSLLRITVPTLVVGDLHGHIIDLFRTVGRFGLPPSSCYLFLGDLVDRGEFSAETTSCIFLLKVLYPDSIYLIRGNHEFLDMAQIGGFCDELRTLYDTNRAESAIMETFSWLPLSAMIGDQVLCVHGGLGPSLYNLDQLTQIQRPISILCDDILQSLLWSDPISRLTGFQPSARGMGYHFGADALTEFLDSQNLLYLVRGHECVQNGVESQLGQKMYTVFGASNYCGKAGNKSGVLLVQPDGAKEAFLFAPQTYIKRVCVSFVQSLSETEAVFQSGAAGPKRKLQSLSLGGKLPSLAQESSRSAGKMPSSRPEEPALVASAATRPARPARLAVPAKRIAPHRPENVGRGLVRKASTFG
jgi:protein phosphatase